MAIDVQEATREYRNAAATTDIPYFEMQPGFENAVERVVRYLRGLS